MITPLSSPGEAGVLYVVNMYAGRLPLVVCERVGKLKILVF